MKGLRSLLTSKKRPYPQFVKSEQLSSKSVETKKMNTPNANNKLSLLTWNVWFGKLEQHIRNKSIISICEELQPDVICLQEVTGEFLWQAKKFSHFLLENYSFFDPFDGSTTEEEYGVLVLCKKHLDPKFVIHKLDSEMGRRLEMAEITTGNERFAVGSVHLESLGSQPTRKKQLEESYAELKQFKSSVLCGDFNFCSERNFSGQGPLDNHCLARTLPGFTDMWPQLHPPSGGESSAGYTFDTDANPMAGGGQPQRFRFDRVMHRLAAAPQNRPCGHSDTDAVPTTQWRAAHIQIVGNSPITERGGVHSCLPSAPLPGNAAPQQIVDPYASPPRKSAHSEGAPVMTLRDRQTLVPLFPSDHFGLYCEFVLETVDAVGGQESATGNVL